MVGMPSVGRVAALSIPFRRHILVCEAAMVLRKFPSSSSLSLSSSSAGGACIALGACALEDGCLRGTARGAIRDADFITDADTGVCVCDILGTGT